MTFHKVKRLSAILICAGLVFTILFFALPTPVNALTVRGPIHILGNSAFTSANGVVSGTGTYADPYIIKGWDINAATNHGIWIEYTTAYFTVENCFVHGGAPNYHGIYLYQAYNGKIINCESSWNLIGISICNSGSEDHGITAENTYEHENWWDGIYLSQSNFTQINNNLLVSNTYGLYCYFSNNNLISNNQANRNKVGGLFLHTANDNIISENKANNNLNYGLYSYNSKGNSLSTNTLNNNNYGFYIQISSDNSFFSNTVDSNNYGFASYSSNSNEFSSNIADKNYAGFYIVSSDSNSFSNNIVNNNDHYGFYFQQSNSNMFNGNSANLNTVYGIKFDLSSSNNHVALNQFQHNSYYDVSNAGTDNSFVNDDYTTSEPISIWVP